MLELASSIFSKRALSLLSISCAGLTLVRSISSRCFKSLMLSDTRLNSFSKPSLLPLSAVILTNLIKSFSCSFICCSSEAMQMSEPESSRVVARAALSSSLSSSFLLERSEIAERIEEWSAVSSIVKESSHLFLP